MSVIRSTSSDTVTTFYVEAFDVCRNALIILQKSLLFMKQSVYFSFFFNYGFSVLISYIINAKFMERRIRSRRRNVLRVSKGKFLSNNDDGYPSRRKQRNSRLCEL